LIPASPLLDLLAWKTGQRQNHFWPAPLRVFLTEMPATLRRISQQNNDLFDVVCIPPFVQETNISLQSIIFKILTDENHIYTPVLPVISACGSNSLSYSALGKTL